MEKIQVEIEGTTSLLQNKYNIEQEKERQKGHRVTKTYDAKEEAKKSAYWSSDGKHLIIPSQVLYASILNASSFHKINRRSAKSILAGSIRIEPEEVPLLDEKGKPIEKYEIDTRPVVIQRARVLKSRARIDKWKAKFEIVYNEKLIGDAEIIKTVLTEAGMRIGIMDFRPQKSGYYGTFNVTKFKTN